LARTDRALRDLPGDLSQQALCVAAAGVKLELRL
jgi:hypothetical protein